MSAAVVSLLNVLPPDEHDRLFPLMAKGAAVYEKLSGRRPSKALVWRHARKGVAGVMLKTVSVGGTMMTTPRWIVEHWAAIDTARRAPKRQRKGTSR